MIHQFSVTQEGIGPLLQTPVPFTAVTSILPEEKDKRRRKHKDRERLGEDRLNSEYMQESWNPGLPQELCQRFNFSLLMGEIKERERGAGGREGVRQREKNQRKRERKKETAYLSTSLHTAQLTLISAKGEKGNTLCSHLQFLILQSE